NKLRLFQGGLALPSSPSFTVNMRAMTTFVALLRGINVGGKNVLPMKDLKAMLTDLGAAGVRTYIQSGNAVFSAEADAAAGLGDRLADAIEAARGFRPQTLVLGAAELAAIADANPFPEATAEPKTLHFFVLERTPPAPDLDALRAIARDSERFELIDRCFYLHAPDGIGRSKLAAKAEKALGVPATARNRRTLSKILELADDDD
ncbi:MAG: DUF1697 domain-containing protein, partial [Acidobacteriota bacterium]